MHANICLSTDIDSDQLEQARLYMSNLHKSHYSCLHGHAFTDADTSTRIAKSEIWHYITGISTNANAPQSGMLT
jgi:hypothetical protein